MQNVDKMLEMQLPIPILMWNNLLHMLQTSLKNYIDVGVQHWYAAQRFPEHVWRACRLFRVWRVSSTIVEHTFAWSKLS